MATMGDLQEAIIEGAVQRIRPKVMTIAAILFGLLPIMWSPTNQAGADVMKRIAAPMIGGVITSGILELLIYPAIYVIWRRHHLPQETRDNMKLSKPPAAGTSEVGPPEAKPSAKRRSFLKILLLVLLIAAVGAGGYFAWTKFAAKPGAGGPSGKPLATQNVNGLTVTLIHPKGQLEHAMNEIIIEFRDTASGQLVDVGSVKFDLDMNMPGMVMHSSATIEPTGTPGQFRAKIKPDMAGDWMATLRYQGPRGNGSVSFSVNVKP